MVSGFSAEFSSCPPHPPHSGGSSAPATAFTAARVFSTFQPCSISPPTSADQSQRGGGGVDLGGMAVVVGDVSESPLASIPASSLSVEPVFRERDSPHWRVWRWECRELRAAILVSNGFETDPLSSAKRVAEVSTRPLSRSTLLPCYRERRRQDRRPGARAAGSVKGAGRAFECSARRRPASGSGFTN